MYFSKTAMGFYPTELRNIYESAGTWPDDAIELTDEEIATYQGKQPPYSKKLGADENGRPVWVDIPPLSEEELQKQKGIAEHRWVKSELERVDEQLKYYWIDDKDRKSHPEQAWKSYAIALRDYTSTDGDGNPVVVGESRPSIYDFIETA